MMYVVASSCAARAAFLFSLFSLHTCLSLTGVWGLGFGACLCPVCAAVVLWLWLWLWLQDTLGAAADDAGKGPDATAAASGSTAE